MFNELEKTSINDQSKEFIELYEKLVAGAKWNNEQLAKGVDIKNELFRFRKIEMKTDAIWRELSDNQKRAVCEVLIDKGLISEKLREILTMFNGTVVSLMK